MFPAGTLLAPTMSAVGAAAGLVRSLRRDLGTLANLGPRKAAAEVRALLPGAAARRSTGSDAGYPVGFPIDLVYTWVDGADPIWRARRDAAWAAANPGEHSTLAANPSRYANRDELRYALRSLAVHADWVRTIYIVTDRQVPPWLNLEHPRVRVVDHTAIFAGGAGLPTFNSHAIESRLHHIEGLAEHYLYLNDDMFFGRPCVPEDFFVGNGLARLFPSPKPLPDGPPGRHSGGGGREEQPRAAHRALRAGTGTAVPARAVPATAFGGRRDGRVVSRGLRPHRALAVPPP